MPDPPDDGRGRWARWWRWGRFGPVAAISLIAFAHDIGAGVEWLFSRPAAPPGTAPAPDLRRIPDPRSELPRGAAAIGIMADWYTSDDYPAAAMREGIAGMTAMRFVIGTNGRVIRCDITQSSGSALLDSTSCNILRRRAIYWPARDKDGHAIPSIGTRKVRWQIAKD